MADLPFFTLRLRKLLADKGITKYALAKLAGLSKQGVANLIVGDREPSWETVQKIARALGVSCEEFTDPSIEAAPEESLRPRGRPPRSDQVPDVQAPAPEPKKSVKKRKGK